MGHTNNPLRPARMAESESSSIARLAWEQGRLAGPVTRDWVASLTPAAARAYIARLGSLVINRERAEFGADETAYLAFKRANDRGDVRVHGSRHA